MQITVKLYATLSRFAPEGPAGIPFSVEVPESTRLAS